MTAGVLWSWSFAEPRQKHKRLKVAGKPVAWVGQLPVWPKVG
jgi:hypothetical protein